MPTAKITNALELTKERQSFPASTPLVDIEERIRGRVQSWHYEDGEAGKMIVIDLYAPNMTAISRKTPMSRPVQPISNEQVNSIGDQSVRPL